MNKLSVLLLLGISAPALRSASLVSLTASASNLGGGGSTTLTATLAGPAAAGGQTLTLQYSDASSLVTPPATIVVPAGQSSGTATVSAAVVLLSNKIVKVTGSDGVNTALVYLALNRPYTPSYPIRICFTPSATAGTCSDPAYLPVTPNLVDRYLTALTAVKYSVAAPAAGAVPHFGVTGSANNYYLIWFDLGVIPPGSTINSAALQLLTYTWYSANDTMAARRILDPDGLAAGCGSCSLTGWSTLGTPDAIEPYSGATAAFRYHTGSGTGVKWRTSDSGSDVDQIQGSLAVADDIQTINTAGQGYLFNVSPSLQAWANGEANQGWAFYTTDGGANGSTYPINIAGNRTQLSVSFTPPDGGDTTPPDTVTDLGVTCVQLLCTLQWTAPADDSATAAYDIRYSNAPITDATFASATPISAVPVNGTLPLPAAPGTLQTLPLTLTEGFTFYFAMRSRDGLSNWSPASNNASITTTSVRGIQSSHPRMLLSGVPDTWNPSKSRLDAIIQRVQSGQPAADLATLRSLADSSSLGSCSRDAGGHTVSCAASTIAGYSDNANFLAYSIPGFLYQVYTGLGDTVSANTYADLVIDKGILSPVSCWNAGNCDVGTDASALGAEGAAVAADWVWTRIEQRGLKPQVIASLEKIWLNQFTNAAFSTNLRESDFHNYSVGWWSAWLACGIALYGEDPLAAALLDKAWGIIDEGYSMVPMESGEAYLYNLKLSITQLTGGAMNWEGPQYWRSAVPEILRAVEEYDTATGRAHNFWANDFETTYRAGLYKIYVQQPDGTFPGIGDATTGNIAAGRDNYAMAVLLDRFKDRPEAGYFKTYIDTLNSWDAGSGGELGLMFKLLFYPYSSLAAKPYTTLPLSDRFGNDVIVRTGWTPADSFFVLEAGYSGAYHRGLAQGGFHLFGGGAPLLLKGGPYDDSSGYYYNNYFRRTIGSNGGLLIYDSSECWRNNTTACTLANDGGQRWPWRRYNPPYNNWEFYVAHLWSASILNTPNAANPAEQYAVAPTGLEDGAGFAYIRSNLTKAYANQFSNDIDMVNPPFANHNTNNRVSLVTRDTVVFTGTGDVVMFDRVKATRATFQKKLVLHTSNAPVLGSLQTSAGDVTYTGQNTLRADHLTGRVFANVLLPAAPNIRVVGGDTCPAIPITSITSSNPVVVTTASAHGLTTGEIIGIVFGSGLGAWANIAANSGGSFLYLSAEVVDPVTFRIRTSNGNYLNSTGYSQPPPSPQLLWHEKCGYEAIVDDFPNPGDPTGHTRIQKNTWIPQSTFLGFSSSPKFRMEIQPSTLQADDNFLVVYRATSNSVSIGPASTLIDSAEFYGALTDDNEIALFAKSPTAVLNGSYEVNHGGLATQVISGLLPHVGYRVDQGSTTVGEFRAGPEGVISFSESGGGVFTIVPLRRPVGAGRSGVNGAIIMK